MIKKVVRTRCKKECPAFGLRCKKMTGHKGFCVCSAGCVWSGSTGKRKK